MRICSVTDCMCAGTLVGSLLLYCLNEGMHARSYAFLLSDTGREGC